MAVGSGRASKDRSGWRDELHLDSSPAGVNVPESRIKMIFFFVEFFYLSSLLSMIYSFPLGNLTAERLQMALIRTRPIAALFRRNVKSRHGGIEDGAIDGQTTRHSEIRGEKNG